MKQNSIIVKIAPLLLILLLTLTACGSAAHSSSAASVGSAASTSGAVIEKGHGQTEFALQVIDADGTQTDFAISTDEKTVGAALLQLELISGENGSYGLYVKTVNGVTADEKAKMYWAFYVDGQYAQTGVDTTNITAGATYTLKLESYS